MVDATAIGVYLTLWLALRAVTLRIAGAPVAINRSPWVTRFALGYCFLCALVLCVAKVWSEWGKPESAPLWSSVGVSLMLVALVVDGICLWALGRLYSLEIGIKKRHTVVRTGLYSLVRHPIYVSNIVGYIGVCILLTHWAAWAGLAAQAVGFFFMARCEESFLIEKLGGEYNQYCQDVRWMFIPGIL